jgi:hypothetical protein
VLVFFEELLVAGIGGEQAGSAGGDDRGDERGGSGRSDEFHWFLCGLTAVKLFPTFPVGIL